MSEWLAHTEYFVLKTFPFHSTEIEFQMYESAVFQREREKKEYTSIRSVIELRMHCYNIYGFH